MATSERIDQLISAVLVNPQAIYDLIDLYLDSGTSQEQRSDIRARIKPLQSEIRFGHLDQRTLEERIRIHVARLSLFDGAEIEAIDWRDERVAYDRFIKTVVDPAIRDKVPILTIIRDIKRLSTHQANAKIASFEELCRHRASEVQKEEAKRWRQERSGERPEQKQAPPISRPQPERFNEKNTVTARFAALIDFQPDLPRRHWVPPWVRFSLYVIIVSITAIIAILQGQDWRFVLLLSAIFLTIVAALSWTYFNRDWGK